MAPTRARGWKRLATPAGAWAACLGLFGLWLLLAWLSRGHGCGMGLGGLACGSWLDYLATFAVFFGWMPAAAAACWATGVSLLALARYLDGR